MLRKLRLVKFRTFEDFTISFGDGAYLVGPNNAGKSTVLTAVRVADVLLRLAQRRNPTENREDGGRHVPAWPMALADFPALRESIRHEFRSAEARLELTWKNGSRATGVWPEDTGEGADPFFYLESKDGLYVRTVQQARTTFSGLGVIPILGPVEHGESLLSDSYVRQSVSGRLSSRHFRNQLRLLDESGEFDRFLAFSEPWLDGLEVERVVRHMEVSGALLDVYYKELGSRIPKELAWAGDGIQVWLQLLYHIHRVMDCPTIVLDEPEVYLHPDLQRRLVNLLESTGRQVIMATHSAEVTAEADPRLVTLVEKTRRTARRAKRPADLEWLSTALGTAFNLRLAKALRSRVVLFVEGQDMSILRRLARTLEFSRVEAERGIAIIRLEGYSRSDQVAPFTWLCEELLPSAIRICLLLDRDYRTEATVHEVEKRFTDGGIQAHVWRRKELESYLLTPAVISRISGASVADVDRILGRVTLAMDGDVFGRLLDERMREERTASRHAVSVASSFKTEFDGDWTDPAFRLQTAPAKLVIAGLNRALVGEGFNSVSARTLAGGHRMEDIPMEMVSALRAVDDAAAL